MEALELYIFCYVQARIYYNWIPETPSKYVDCSPSYITTLISGIGLKGRGNERERREEEERALFVSPSVILLYAHVPLSLF
jgi:hypothetical protein